MENCCWQNCLGPEAPRPVFTHNGETWGIGGRSTCQDRCGCDLYPDVWNGTSFFASDPIAPGVCRFSAMARQMVNRRGPSS